MQTESILFLAARETFFKIDSKLAHKTCSSKCKGSEIIPRILLDHSTMKGIFFLKKKEMNFLPEFFQFQTLM